MHLQGGGVAGEPDRPLDLEQIMAMDYLVENVDGRIPVYDELDPTGKATVDTVGVEVSKNPEGAKG